MSNYQRDNDKLAIGQMCNYYQTGQLQLYIYIFYKKQQLKTRRMVQFSLQGMFRTSSKGLPDTSNLEPYTYLSMNHFIYSLGVQIIIGLLLIGYTGLAAYRAFYKIKNERFFPANDDMISQQQVQDQSQKQKAQDNQVQSQTNDNLIYRFDEQDNEKQNKQKPKQSQNEPQEDFQHNQLDQEEPVSQETTDWFLSLDHKVVFFQPFIISFVVAANVFAADVFLLLLMLLALVLYFLFNIKMYCRKLKILQLAFAAPCCLAFFTVFFQDRDMST